MSREKNLQKAIVLSLLLTNVWCGAAYAADGTDGADGTDISVEKVITAGGLALDETDSAANGTNGANGGNGSGGAGGNGGNGGAGKLAYTVGGTVNNIIDIAVKSGDGGRGGNGVNGGNGGNGGNIEMGLTVSEAVFSSNYDVILYTAGGNGGINGGAEAGATDGQSGAGGWAVTKGLMLKEGLPAVSITIGGNLISEAWGGKGGYGGNSTKGSKGSEGSSAGADGAVGTDGGNGGAGGNGGSAEATTVTIAGGIVDLTVASGSNITAQANGGSGGHGGNGGNGGNGGYGADGAVGTDGGNGGAGGNGGKGGNGGNGGNGGHAKAIAVAVTGGTVKLTADAIDASAKGGKGGSGGDSGKGGNGGNGGRGTNNGGNGGNGGRGGTNGSIYGMPGLGSNAEARAVSVAGAAVDLTVERISASAEKGTKGHIGSSGGGGSSLGGTGGAGGSGGTGSAGNAGYDGDPGKPQPPIQAPEDKSDAKAYGIYAEQRAVINLHAKDPSTGIKISAKVKNATGNTAYAVYADNAAVLFHDKATLNTSNSSTEDNTVLTYLNNATFGFGGTAVKRTITGGILELQGSNTFMVNTNLAAGDADKLTFDSLAAGSSTDKQYITVGYDASLDPYKEGSVGASSGNPIDVLEITNLNGQDLNNFTGGTTTLDSVLYQYSSTTNVNVNNNKVQITGVTTTKTMNASESVKTASDAQMAMRSMWSVEGNNLMKRMGELRSDKEAAQGGVWARYYRGELSADSAYDRSFDQDYTAFQGGIDKVQDYKGGKLYTGIAVNRIDSKAGYTMGSGDLSSTGVGLYASWLGSKGHYVDVIARGSKLTNDFKLVDLSGNAAKADYDTWAYGISAEYGYRQDLNAGWFVEPQAELSLGHIGSADYTMSNGGHIENDSVNSAIVRLGFLGGKEFTIGGRTSNAYVKASALHDFGGNGGVTAYSGNDSLALQTGDLTGTWYEIGLGANLGIAKNSNLYFDALKTFGGDLRTDWQFNAGLRFSF